MPEYWRFDPSGGEYHDAPLSGGLLVDGAYHPVELTTEPDGILKGYSPLLELSLAWMRAGRDCMTRPPEPTWRAGGKCGTPAKRNARPGWLPKLAPSPPRLKRSCSGSSCDGCNPGTNYSPVASY